jgi:putative transposase
MTLKHGVYDVIIACVDGLKGFPEAITTAFPKTEVQLCIIHQIRNSFKLVLSKDQKLFIADLKLVYQAANKDIAAQRLAEMAEKWPKYHTALKSWVTNWELLTTYFKYSESIRRLVYTTNPIESFHRQIRKYTKTKAAFVSESALLKLVFCAINRISDKWSQPLHNWALTLSELDLHFPDRLPLR